MTTAAKAKKISRRKGGKIAQGLALPASTATIELGGTTYYVTPSADMEEWLEDVEDILDSKKALEEPGESIPFERVVKNLGLKLPPRRKK